MKAVLDYLWAAITVLCLGSKAMQREATIYDPELEYEESMQEQACLYHGGTGPARNLSSTRRGWGYIPGNR